MSLAGGKLICLNEDGSRGRAFKAKGRKFSIGYYMSCDCILQDARAKGVHCEIQCDAFGRVTINNMSEEQPICINGKPIMIKRPLLNGTEIKILDKRYLWEFVKATSSEYEDINTAQTSTPQKQIGIPEQPPNSCPNLKLHRAAVQRLTVHAFRFCIQSDDEGNTSAECSMLSPAKPEETTDTTSATPVITKESIKETNELNIPPAAPPPNIDQPAARSRSKTPEIPINVPLISVTPSDQVPLVTLTPSTNLIIDATDNKENATSPIKQKMLALCKRSELLVTSFSPRQTGVHIGKSFTAVYKPKTPKSVYSTPKGGGMPADGTFDDLGELIDFSTPATSHKLNTKNTSMHLIDLTTPVKLRPESPFPKSALKSGVKVDGTPTKRQQQQQQQQLAVDDDLGVKQLPATPTLTVSGCQNDTPSTVDSVITVESSPSVVEVSCDDSTPGQDAYSKTPNKNVLLAKTAVTPKRTPQSLMKRALLTSAKKQNNALLGLTPRRLLGTPRTPTDANSQQRLSLVRQRQCLTTPARKSLSASLKTPESASSSTSRRSSLMPAKSLNDSSAMTSTPVGRSTRMLRMAANTSPLHGTRRALAFAKAKVRTSTSPIAISNKLVAKARKSVYSPRSTAAAKAAGVSTPRPNIAKNAATPTAVAAGGSILKSVKRAAAMASSSSANLPKKAVLFESKTNESSAEATLERQATFTVENEPTKDVTFSPSKESEQVEPAALDKTFSPVKSDSIPKTNDLLVEDVVDDAGLANIDLDSEDSDELIKQVNEALNTSRAIRRKTLPSCDLVKSPDEPNSKISRSDVSTAGAATSESELLNEDVPATDDPPICRWSSAELLASPTTSGNTMQDNNQSKINATFDKATLEDLDENETDELLTKVTDVEGAADAEEPTTTTSTNSKYSILIEEPQDEKSEQAADIEQDLNSSVTIEAVNDDDDANEAGASNDVNDEDVDELHLSQPIIQLAYESDDPEAGMSSTKPEEAKNHNVQIDDISAADFEIVDSVDELLKEGEILDEDDELLITTTSAQLPNTVSKPEVESGLTESVVSCEAKAEVKALVADESVESKTEAEAMCVDDEVESKLETKDVESSCKEASDIESDIQTIEAAEKIESELMEEGNENQETIPVATEDMQKMVNEASTNGKDSVVATNANDIQTEETKSQSVNESTEAKTTIQTDEEEKDFESVKSPKQTDVIESDVQTVYDSSNEAEAVENNLQIVAKVESEIPAKATTETELKTNIESPKDCQTVQEQANKTLEEDKELTETESLNKYELMETVPEVVESETSASSASQAVAEAVSPNKPKEEVQSLAETADVLETTKTPIENQNDNIPVSSEENTDTKTAAEMDSQTVKQSKLAVQTEANAKQKHSIASGGADNLSIDLTSEISSGAEEAAPVAPKPSAASNKPEAEVYVVFDSDSEDAIRPKSTEEAAVNIETIFPDPDEEDQIHLVLSQSTADENEEVEPEREIPETSAMSIMVEDDDALAELQVTTTPTKLNSSNTAQTTELAAKTPNMCGVRELMQTPKATGMATPNLNDLRHLARTPKGGAEDLDDSITMLFSTPKPKAEQQQKDEIVDISEGMCEVVDVQQNEENQEPDRATVESTKPTNTIDLTDYEYAKEVATDNQDTGTPKSTKHQLRTPRGCSTPHFKGLREMMQTPKQCSTPYLGGLKKLMDTPTLGTPISRITPEQLASKDARQQELTVGHSAMELANQSNDPNVTEGLDKFFRTPRAKNVMISTTNPASAVLKPAGDSVELVHANEYSLNATATANLEDIFKTPVATRFAERLTDTIEGDDEHNSLVHKESPFSGAGDVISDLPKADVQQWVNSLEDAEVPADAVDPLADDDIEPHNASDLESASKSYRRDNTAASEAMIDVSVASAKHDPLASAAKIILDTNEAEISGINLLDQTEGSVFSEPLAVSESESLNQTQESANDDDDNNADAARERAKVDEAEAEDGFDEPLLLSSESVRARAADLEIKQVAESQVKDSQLASEESEVNKMSEKQKEEGETESTTEITKKNEVEQVIEEIAISEGTEANETSGNTESISVTEEVAVPEVTQVATVEEVSEENATSENIAIPVGNGEVVEKEDTKQIAEPEVAEEVPESEVTEEVAKPEVTEEVAEPEFNEEVAESEVTEEVAESEVTEEVAESEVTEEVAEPEVTEKVAEPEVTEKVAEPEGTPDVAVTEEVASTEVTENDDATKASEVVSVPEFPKENSALEITEAVVPSETLDAVPPSETTETAAPPEAEATESVAETKLHAITRLTRKASTSSQLSDSGEAPLTPRRTRKGSNTSDTNLTPVRRSKRKASATEDIAPAPIEEPKELEIIPEDEAVEGAEIELKTKAQQLTESLQNVGTPRRKRRGSQSADAVSTPVRRITRRSSTADKEQLDDVIAATPTMKPIHENVVAALKLDAQLTGTPTKRTRRASQSAAGTPVLTPARRMTRRRSSASVVEETQTENLHSEIAEKLKALAEEEAVDTDEKKEVEIQQETVIEENQEPEPETISPQTVPPSTEVATEEKMLEVSEEIQVNEIPEPIPVTEHTEQQLEEQKQVEINPPVTEESSSAIPEQSTSVETESTPKVTEQILSKIESDENSAIVTEDNFPSAKETEKIDEDNFEELKVDAEDVEVLETEKVAKDISEETEKLEDEIVKAAEEAENPTTDEAENVSENAKRSKKDTEEVIDLLEDDETEDQTEAERTTEALKKRSTRDIVEDLQVTPEESDEVEVAVAEEVVDLDDNLAEIEVDKNISQNIEDEVKESKEEKVETVSERVVEEVIDLFEDDDEEAETKIDEVKVQESAENVRDNTEPNMPVEIESTAKVVNPEIEEKVVNKEFVETIADFEQPEEKEKQNISDTEDPKAEISENTPSAETESSEVAEKEISNTESVEKKETETAKSAELEANHPTQLETKANNSENVHRSGSEKLVEEVLEIYDDDDTVDDQEDIQSPKEGDNIQEANRTVKNQSEEIVDLFSDEESEGQGEAEVENDGAVPESPCENFEVAEENKEAEIFEEHHEVQVETRDETVVPMKVAENAAEEVMDVGEANTENEAFKSSEEVVDLFEDDDDDEVQAVTEKEAEYENVGIAVEESSEEAVEYDEPIESAPPKSTAEIVNLLDDDSNEEDQAKSIAKEVLEEKETVIELSEEQDEFEITEAPKEVVIEEKVHEEQVIQVIEDSQEAVEKIPAEETEQIVVEEEQIEVRDRDVEAAENANVADEVIDLDGDENEAETSDTECDLPASAVVDLDGEKVSNFEADKASDSESEVVAPEIVDLDAEKASEVEPEKSSDSESEVVAPEIVDLDAEKASEVEPEKSSDSESEVVVPEVVDLDGEKGSDAESAKEIVDLGNEKDSEVEPTEVLSSEIEGLGSEVVELSEENASKADSLASEFVENLQVGKTEESGEIEEIPVTKEEPTPEIAENLKDIAEEPKNVEEAEKVTETSEIHTEVAAMSTKRTRKASQSSDTGAKPAKRTRRKASETESLPDETAQKAAPGTKRSRRKASTEEKSMQPVLAQEKLPVVHEQPTEETEKQSTKEEKPTNVENVPEMETIPDVAQPIDLPIELSDEEPLTTNDKSTDVGVLATVRIRDTQKQTKPVQGETTTLESAEPTENPEEAPKTAEEISDAVVNEEPAELKATGGRGKRARKITNKDTAEPSAAVEKAVPARGRRGRKNTEESHAAATETKHSDVAAEPIAEREEQQQQPIMPQIEETTETTEIVEEHFELVLPKGKSKKATAAASGKGRRGGRPPKAQEVAIAEAEEPKADGIEILDKDKPAASVVVSEDKETNKEKEELVVSEPTEIEEPKPITTPPKRRGRKPTTDTNDIAPPTKRGRGRAAKTEAQADETAVEQQPAAAAGETVSPVKDTLAGGRKRGAAKANEETQALDTLEETPRNTEEQPTTDGAAAVENIVELLPSPPAKRARKSDELKAAAAQPKGRKKQQQIFAEDEDDDQHSHAEADDEEELTTEPVKTKARRGGAARKPNDDAAKIKSPPKKRGRAAKIANEAKAEDTESTPTTTAPSNDEVADKKPAGARKGGRPKKNAAAVEQPAAVDDGALESHKEVSAAESDAGAVVTTPPRKNKRGRKASTTETPLSQRREGRNMPKRNYDESSDNEIPIELKRRPSKSDEGVAFVTASAATMALAAAAAAAAKKANAGDTPSTGRGGRQRKPTAKVQQFLEDARARTGNGAATPKRREEAGAEAEETPKSMPVARRGRLASATAAHGESVPTAKRGAASKRGEARNLALDEPHSSELDEEHELAEPQATADSEVSEAPAAAKPRGRKPKQTASEAVVAVSTTGEDQSATTTNVEAPAKRTYNKKGKKAAEVAATVMEVESSTTTTTEIEEEELDDKPKTKKTARKAKAATATTAGGRKRKVSAAESEADFDEHSTELTAQQQAGGEVPTKRLAAVIAALRTADESPAAKRGRAPRKGAINAAAIDEVESNEAALASAMEDEPVPSTTTTKARGGRGAAATNKRKVRFEAATAELNAGTPVEAASEAVVAATVEEMPAAVEQPTTKRAPRSRRK